MTHIRLEEVLRGIDGVASVVIERNIAGVEDLEICFTDGAANVITVQHRDDSPTARVFFRSYRIEELPIAWLREFVQNVSRGRFTAFPKFVQMNIDGERRKFG